MAIHVVTGGFLSVGAADLSAYVQSVTFDEESDEVESTVWGQTQRSFVVGLSTASMRVTFAQDYDASALYQTIAPFYKTSQAFVLRPFNGAASTSNPEWAGNVLVSQLTHLDASQGDLNTQNVQWRAFDITTVYA
ncbi:MAG: hypothetical protein HKN01_01570 [Acidimicrobiia bacterium]|nr:hypothetical protein [Acidimicrobiia bacterium]